MRILVTRPTTDATTLQARLQALDHEPLAEPLLTLSFEGAEAVDLSEVQAIIATSRNALRGLDAQAAVAIASKLPIFTVGPGTAAEARRLGFELVLAGKGTVRDLVPEIVANVDPHAGPLLYPAGDVVASDLAGDLAAHGFRVEQPVVYRMVPVTRLSRLTLAALGAADLDAVLLLSPRTASAWVTLVQKSGLSGEAARLLHVCLSPAVAAKLAPLGKVRVEVAKTPTLEGVLDLLT